MKVFIVEDSSVMRERLSSMLTNISDVEVIGHSDDEAGAIERIDALLPDAVILDISLQPGSGINVLEHIKKHHAGIKVMVLTNYIDDFYVKRCKSAGADYFFDKTFQFSQVRAVFWKWVNTGCLDNKAGHKKVNTLQKSGG